MSRPRFNGYLLGGVLVPEEILIHLMSFADAETLLRCRLVCRVWHELVDRHVWRHKMQREGHRYRSSKALDPGRELPWLVYHSICSRDPYSRNLLKNPCGEDGFKHWNILQNGGNRFIVENGPVGANRVPAAVGSQYCFVSSFGDCSKDQWVDLVAEGVPPRVMDEIRPTIFICDWFANRFDCGAVYELRVSLCSADRQPLKVHTCLKQMVDGESIAWRQKSKVFIDYPAGVRLVHFYHRGKDTRYWAGHYGAKVTGSSIRLTFLKASEEFNTGSSGEDIESDDSYLEGDW